MSYEAIAVLDFGSQYSQLIARRVREHNVYSQIFRAEITTEELSRLGVKGLILSGGPASVYDKNAPKCNEKIFELTDNRGVLVVGRGFDGWVMFEDWLDNKYRFVARPVGKRHLLRRSLW